jgi:hypothetical protein
VDPSLESVDAFVELAHGFGKLFDHDEEVKERSAV